MGPAAASWAGRAPVTTVHWLQERERFTGVLHRHPGAVLSLRRCRLRRLPSERLHALVDHRFRIVRQEAQSRDVLSGRIHRVVQRFGVDVHHRDRGLGVFGRGRRDRIQLHHELHAPARRREERRRATGQLTPPQLCGQDIVDPVDVDHGQARRRVLGRLLSDSHEPCPEGHSRQTFLQLAMLRPVRLRTDPSDQLRDVRRRRPDPTDNVRQGDRGVRLGGVGVREVGNSRIGMHHSYTRVVRTPRAVTLGRSCGRLLHKKKRIHPLPF